MYSVAAGQIVAYEYSFTLVSEYGPIPSIFFMCPFLPFYFLFAAHRVEIEAFVKSCRVADDSSRYALEYVGADELACVGYWVHTANRAVRTGGSAYALTPRTAERIGSLKLKVLQVITTII